MRIAQAAVEGVDAESAARELATRLGVAERGPPAWATAHFGAAMPAEELRSALLRELFGATAERAALHGGGSCLGVMGAEGALIEAGDGVGVLAVWDDRGDYGVAAASLGDSPEDAAAQAARAAAAVAGRAGEAPELVWLTASPGEEEAVIAGVETVFGGTTAILGGSAADNDVSGRWRVFDSNRSLVSGVVVSALFPSAPAALRFRGGYAPRGAAGAATRVEGRRLLEIDGRPAREVYEAWTGRVFARPSAPILSDTAWAPLGREIGQLAGMPFHLLVHPASADADGGLTVFAAVREGERLYLMGGDPGSLAARAGALAREAVADEALCGRVVGALVVFCGGCMLAMRERMPEVAATLREAFGDAPFLTAFTFGEQGPSMDEANVHGNLMIGCVAFGGS